MYSQIPQVGRGIPAVVLRYPLWWSFKRQTFEQDGVDLAHSGNPRLKVTGLDATPR